MHTYEEEIAPTIATHLQDALERANATDIAALDTMHAQEQEVLFGVALQMLIHALFDVVDGAKVQVALHGDDPQLWADWLARLVAPMAEVLVGQDRHDPRHTG